jgi:hypothetical protein
VNPFDFLGKAEVFGDVISACEIPIAFRCFELVPENIGKYGVESHCTSLVKTVIPVLIRYPLRIHLPPSNAVRFSIEKESAVIPSE